MMDSHAPPRRPMLRLRGWLSRGLRLRSAAILALVLVPVLTLPAHVRDTGSGDLLSALPVVNESDISGDFTRKTNACGVAAATLILDYYLPQSGSTRATLSLDAVSKYVKEKWNTNPDGSKAYGTDGQHLADGLVQASVAPDLGVNVALTDSWRFTDKNGWFSALKAELDAKLPVIVYLDDGSRIDRMNHYGHFIVVSGYTANDDIIAHDPWYAPGDPLTPSKTIPNATFAAAWGATWWHNQSPYAYLEVLPPGTSSPIATATGSTTDTTVTPTTAPAQRTVYIGATDGTVRAFNASDGSPRWQFNTGGMAAAVLATGNGLVYVEPMQGIDVSIDPVPPLYALNVATGAMVWQWSPANPPQPAGFAPPSFFLTLSGNTIYMSSSVATSGDTLVALDATIGKPRWQHTFSDANWEFTTDQHFAYVVRDNGSGATTVDALSADSGNPAWSQTVQGDSAYGPLVAADGVAYVGTCIKGSVACNSLIVYALDGSSGAPRWQHDNGSGSTMFVQVNAGRVYVDTNGTDQSQYVSILDAHTGSPLPHAPLSCGWADVFPTTTSAYESCSLNSLAVVAFDPTTGQQQWEQQALQNGGQTFISVQAVEDGIVYVNDGSQAGAEGGNQAYYTAYALDASTGAVRWHMDGQIAAAASGIAVVTATDGTCVVMSDGNSSPLWRYHAGTFANGPGSPTYWPSVLIG